MAPLILNVDKEDGHDDDIVKTLVDFLQPDTKLFVGIAANNLIRAITKSVEENKCLDEDFSLLLMDVLLPQIPYNHTSIRKLARLLRDLGQKSTERGVSASSKYLKEKVN